MSDRSSANNKFRCKDGNLHLSECYMVMYPDDESVYCTCKDWSPS